MNDEREGVSAVLLLVFAMLVVVLALAVLVALNAPKVVGLP